MKYTLLIFFILIISCNKNPNIAYESIVKRNDSLMQTIPNNIQPMELYWQYHVINHNESLLDTDVPLKNIYKYSINNKKWDILNFKSEGPDGVGIGTGFHYINKDSIFIFSGYQHKMFLFDDELHKVKTYKLPNDYNINLFTNRKCIKIKDNLFMQGTEFLQMNKEFCNNAKLLLKYNLTNSKYRKIINYPEKYKSKRWMPKHLSMDYVINNERIISSFAITDSIYIYNLDGVLLKTKLAKSKYINNIKPINNNIDDNSQKAMNILYENGFYSGLLYDKYKDVFYRFAYHLPYNKISNNVKLKHMTLSIIVLDNNMKYINEFIPNMASGYYKFVNEKGLVLSVNPNFTTNLKEGQRKFYIYNYE